MLFMAIATYEAEKRNETVKREQETREIGRPNGTKRVGEWSVIGGGKVFMLVDVEDPKASFAATLARGDLCKIEIIPVIETEEVL